MELIVIVPINPFSLNSASANRLLALLEGLSAQNINIELFITCGFSNLTEFKKNGFTGNIKKIKYIYLLPTLNSNLLLRRLNTYLILPLIEPILVWRIVNTILKKNKKKLIVWPSFDLIGLKVIDHLKRKKIEIKTFIELSEFLDIHHFNKGSKISKKREDKVKDLFEKNVFYKFDAIALMTKTLLRHYESFPEPRPMLFHLPMTVDLERFKEVKVQPNSFIKPYIAFVGTMNDNKEGVSILIKAFYEIKDLQNDLKLYLVGPWHYDTQEHLRLIKNFKLEDRIFWMGEYSREIIPSILQNAELLVLPRPDSKQAQGGFPTKLGEYLATGVPVCTTTVGEIPYYLKDGKSAYFAEPGQITSFANAMLKALNNREEATIIGINGRKVAETHFNKDKQSKYLFEIFNSILK